MTPRYQRTERVGPTLLKDAEIANRGLKSCPVSVHSTENYLILEHLIEEQEVGIHFDTGRFVRHTGRDEDGVGTQYAHDIEGDPCGSRRFVDEIDVANQFAKLLDRCGLAGD